MFDPGQLNEIDPRYADCRVPLTRHMVATWNRFDQRNSYHLNSDRSRLAYMVWYLWDFMPDRQFVLPALPARILDALNASAAAFGTMTRFLFEVWQRHYRSAYPIFEEEGYDRFLCHVAVHEARRRSLARDLFPYFVSMRLNSGQPGFGDPAGGHYLTRALYRIWEGSDLYRQKYPDLHAPGILQSYVFDQIVHLGLREGNTEFFPDEQQRWWKQALHPELPRLSRFLLQLARYSRGFSPRLKKGRLSRELYEQIIDWFDHEVLPQWPAAAAFVPSSAPPAAEPVAAAAFPFLNRRRVDPDSLAPLLPTGDDEIDVLVIGPYKDPTGLGSGTRRSVGALKRTGCNFRIIDLKYGSPVPSKTGEVDAKHLYRGEKAKINLWHYNGEYIADPLMICHPLTLNRRNIGYFFWETETLPISHELGQRVVDEIWTPSQFVAGTYSSADVPVINVGTSVELPRLDCFYGRSYFSLAEDETVFMFSFDAYSSIHRKNPAAVLRAFLKAFGHTNHRVRLIIKTQNMGSAHWGSILGRGEEMFELCQYDRRITLIDRTMTVKELYSLKHCANCYVSLHRSEGFGYGPAEAMALGKPVIMTDYSANREFGNELNALMAPAKIVPIMPEEFLYWTPGMVWGEADIEAAANHMLRIYEDPEFASKLGTRARESIIRNFGVEAMAARYAKRLQELGIPCPAFNENGESIAISSGTAGGC
jgi:glycosyltransferase involved in cell wall biosynthesis